MPLIAALLTTPTALGQSFQSHGLNFVTVGDPGNRGATAAEAPLWPTWAPPLGAVDHTFGIMRTNITNTQWIEFVRAYAPHYQGQPFELELTGSWISYAGTSGGVAQFTMPAGSGQYTVNPSWRVAARYCNWLHNDKQSMATAFENGAYDTSTFGEISIGGITHYTDQFTHNPDAKFWIPTIHEYTKAGYFDPSRYGPGQGGYWLMPDAGNEPLNAGPPGVGETAGDWLAFGQGIPVESYPTTLSPWGLLDVSGTEAQFTEGYVHPTTGTRRLTQGSTTGSSAFAWDDRIDTVATAFPGIALGGVRLATALPTPASALPMLILGALSTRRRRSCETHCRSWRPHSWEAGWH